MYKRMVMAAMLLGLAAGTAGCQAGGQETGGAVQAESPADTQTVPAAEGISYAEPTVLVKGEHLRLKLPSNFKGKIRWNVTNQMPNVGYSQKKGPLKEGETDGDRSAGLASASHLAQVEEDGTVTALEKGNHIFVTAEDEAGNQRIFPLEIRAYFQDQLPKAASSDFKALRTRYVERLTGGSEAASDPAAERILAKIDQDCKAAWDSYGFKGQACTSAPWEEDLEGGTLEAFKDDAVKFQKSYQKAEAMAKAYAAPGSSYYKNKDLLADICGALDYLSENCYYPRSETNNWWNWEIGLPKTLLPTVLYIYDDIGADKSREYAQSVAFFQPDPFHMGILGTASTIAAGYREAASANLMDCAYTALGLGLIYEDGEYLTLARDAAATTLEKFQEPVKGSDGKYTYPSGFYEDGSYIDHGTVPYTASYGMEFLKGSVKLSVLLGDTPWQLAQENRDMLEAYILRGYLPAVYKGAALDMLRGRAVSRPTLTDRDAGRQLIEMLVQTTDLVSDEGAGKIKGAVKYWISQSGPEEFVEGIQDVAVLQQVQALLADETVDTSMAQEPFHRVYPYMDRTIHRTGDYLFGVSMYSSRISNCEIMNDENLKGWYTGFGMTYLYNDDLTQYTDHFWDTVDPLRLPGTTVVPVEIDNGEPDSSGFHQCGDFLSPEDWVGGTSIGDFGVSGMLLNGTAVHNGDKSNASETVYADHLRAKKSYFMFDEEIVCLGAGIENSGFDVPVITTVENRKLKEDASNRIVSDAGELSRDGEQVISPRWLHLEGNAGPGSDIGYFFPETPQLHTAVESRSGSYRDIKGDLPETEETVTRHYFTCWFDHGTEPKDGQYSYVLLPGLSKEQTMAYSGQPDMEILENSSRIQAVADHSTQTLAANFWAEDGGSVQGLSCSGQASVMTGREGNVLTVALSDPTMLNEGVISLTLQDMGEATLLKADQGVTFTAGNGAVSLQFDVNGQCGNTLTAQIEVQ